MSPAEHQASLALGSSFTSLRGRPVPAATGWRERSTNPSGLAGACTVRAKLCSLGSE